MRVIDHPGIIDQQNTSDEQNASIHDSREDQQKVGTSDAVMVNAIEQGPTLLFDGECNLCNGWVKFVLRRERDDSIIFGTLQSDFGHRVLKQHGLPETLDTVVFVQEGQAYVRSTAALKIANHLRWPWRWALLFFAVPRFLRDAVYRLVAVNRYRIFGKTDSCMIPSPEVTRRFFTT